MQAQKITFSQNQEATGDKTAYAGSQEKESKEKIAGNKKHLYRCFLSQLSQNVGWSQV